MVSRAICFGKYWNWKVIKQNISWYNQNRTFFLHIYFDDNICQIRHCVLVLLAIHTQTHTIYHYELDKTDM
jgi:hypothetical protein